MDNPDPSTEKRKFLSDVEVLLRGHLMDIYSQVNDSCTLRVVNRIKGLDAQCLSDLQKEAERVWQDAGGVMSSSVMDYVRGAFVDSLKSICETLGWSVENKECDERFVEEVVAIHGGQRDAWLASAVNTPCLVVNARIKSSSDRNKRTKSSSGTEESTKYSFDGADPKRICKADVNIFDLFQVVACSGHVVFLRAKNNTSTCLVPSLVVNGSRRYIFEVSSMFELEDAARRSDSQVGLICLSNGIVCDPLGRCVYSSDNQGLVCAGTLSMYLAAIASRFRVPYSMVDEFMQGNSAGMSVDHCSMDNSSNPPHNFRVADVSAQELNRAAECFTWQYLGTMGEEDRTRITTALRTAQQNDEVYRLVAPVGAKRLKYQKKKKIVSDGHVYSRRCPTYEPWTSNNASSAAIVYRPCRCQDQGSLGCQAPGDVLTSEKDQTEYQELIPLGSQRESVYYVTTEDDTVFLRCDVDPNNLHIDICSLQMISVKWYLSHGLCDVSNLAEQQQLQYLTVAETEYDVARILAYSNALHCGDDTIQVLVSDGAVRYAKVKDGSDCIVVQHRNGNPMDNFIPNLESIIQHTGERKRQRCGSNNAEVKYHFRISIPPSRNTIQKEMTIPELYEFVTKANVKTRKGTLKSWAERRKMSGRTEPEGVLKIELLDGEHGSTMTIIYLKNKIDPNKGFHIDGIH